MISESMMEALLIIAVVTSLRNFVWLHYRMQGSLIINILMRLARILGLLKKEEPKGGNVILTPGKGFEGAPDGAIIFLDANKKEIARWPAIDKESNDG